jgi:subtilase family serine protease
MNMKMISKRKEIQWVVTPVVMGLISLSAFALPHLPGKAHTPRIVKPNTPNFAPSGLSPSQVATAYGFNNFASQGSGQTIALVDAFDSPTIENDLNIFSSTFGLPACTTANGCFSIVYAGGTKPQPNGDWEGETSLDVEWAHALAPKEKIMLVEATDDSMDSLMQAVQVAVQKGANVISMSWGGPEDANETGNDTVFNNPNVTFTASSGDSGYGVSYPAASPYVLSVGGTTLSVDGSGNYQGEVAWSGSGGGLSAYETEPAYQSQYQIPNNPNNMRGVPDVSYNADPNSGFSVYDSTPDSGGNSGWQVVGGTSAAAPQWAAFIADVNSSGSALNGVSNLLYGAATANYSTDFNDVTTGSNGSCGVLCNASTGYDYVTGLGTPQVVSLAADLSNNVYKAMKKTRTYGSN